MWTQSDPAPTLALDLHAHSVALPAAAWAEGWRGELCLKRGFHRQTNIDEINHRCIKISQQVVQTCRHRRMDIGAAWLPTKSVILSLVGRRSAVFDKKVKSYVSTN